jgi:hypothetical protein
MFKVGGLVKHSWRSFIQGMGSVFDISGGAFSRPRRKMPKPLTDEEAWAKDTAAIRSDWDAIGEDIRRAVERFRGNDV